MPFVKGKSGNPGGRPKKEFSITNLLKEELERANVQDEAGVLIEARRAVARRLVQLAISGDMPAIKYIMDRIDGQPRQALEVSGGDDPIGLIFVRAGAATEEDSSSSTG